MARSSIGLDIGTRAVRLAEIQTVGGRPALTRFGRMLLPVGAVDHGEIHEVQAVATAITTLWKRLGLQGRAVHVGVSNRRVVVRVVELPAMSRDDLEGAIRFQAQEHIPIPLDQAVMDFEVLEEVAGVEGAAEGLQRVLVVAAERATIEPLLAAISAAKLELASLELNAYPLVRTFGGSDETEAIVDMGAGVTNVVVHRAGKIRFTRILPTFGGDEFTQAVASSLEIDRDEAEILKRRASVLLSERARRPVASTMHSSGSLATAVGGTTSFSAPEATGPQVVADDDDDFRDATAITDVASPLERAARVVEPILDRFTTEVRGSLDFYASQAGAVAVDRVVLTGGGALMGGLRERLHTSLQIDVEVGHPFERVPVGDVQVTAEERAVAEPFMGVVVGLALAGVK